MTRLESVRHRSTARNGQRDDGRQSSKPLPIHRGIVVSESARIIEALKRSLKNRGLTYRDLARKVGLSEASIKRVFAEETFSLQRLEHICLAIGLSVSELVRMAGDSQEPRSQYLSLEQ